MALLFCIKAMQTPQKVRGTHPTFDVIRKRRARPTHLFCRCGSYVLISLGIADSLYLLLDMPVLDMASASGRPLFLTTGIIY
jgi:hypothetical protein